eukprot:3703777-Heterocapsa_arctica.AAC.1
MAPRAWLIDFGQGGRHERALCVDKAPDALLARAAELCRAQLGLHGTKEIVVHYSGERKEGYEA